MSTANVIGSQLNTFNISNSAGDTVKTRNFYVRAKNLGANQVSVSEISAPTGAATAGQQSTLQPAGASNKADDMILRPNTTYFLTAATGATLVAFEEIPSKGME